MTVVYYFVIAQDGSRYGPADIDTLVQWTREGRIIESTLLVERGTERQLSASEITAIAVELRRSMGGAGVAIERGQPSGFDEKPTMTRPGAPAGPIKPAPYPPLPPMPPTNFAQARTAGSVHDANFGTRSRIAAGLLGIFFGGFGIHRFYLGYTGVGLLMLFLSVIGGGLTVGYSCGFVGLWGFIEGIICLCGGMKDADGKNLRE
ncbi:MAG: TM2 domain-containing protein [Phycisphaerae bacterium]|nr:TM2 domain-containing protein [Phycisphaerae bacterium]